MRQHWDCTACALLGKTAQLHIQLRLKFPIPLPHQTKLICACGTPVEQRLLKSYSARFSADDCTGIQCYQGIMAQLGQSDLLVYTVPLVDATFDVVQTCDAVSLSSICICCGARHYKMIQVCMSLSIFHQQCARSVTGNAGLESLCRGV